ncbi:putative e3 ubiquitin-protein ligase hip1 [Nicotiana attenuata]|uniref:RING-type E3 ubiquitin transferase n=1 Tax=Nicotiana attenuata TaxID=49451 RepID=A0A314KHK1_NICAT|nr:putative e3 ubiquitin-protein ligase hip1 [Nicotiana attenuata]
MATNWQSRHLSQQPHYHRQALANHNVSRNHSQIPDGFVFPRNTRDYFAPHNLFHGSAFTAPAHTYNNRQTTFDHSEDPYLPYNYQPTSEYVDDVYVATDLANYHHDLRNSSQSRNVSDRFAPHNLFHNYAQSSFNHIEDPYLGGNYFVPTTEFIDGVYVTTQSESNDGVSATTESDFIHAYITALNHILNRIQDQDIINFISPSSGQQGAEADEEEIMAKCMKTRTYCGSTSKVDVNSEETVKAADEEGEICVICQGEYVNDEIIGTLECGHEYHGSCIKQWLLKGKNTCPICRSSVLPSQEQSS